MNLQELIHISKRKLSEAGIKNSRFVMISLFRGVLSLNEADLILNGEKEIESKLSAKYMKAVERVVEGEPIDYVLGFREFFGIRLGVTRSVLIPRNETEELVEIVIDEEKNSKVFADIGTGSGAIACALARNIPSSLVFATDISRDALMLAEKNARTNGIFNIRFIEGDNISGLNDFLDSVEVIVSNPPYVRTGDLDSLDTNVRKYEPIVALDGGKDGLDFYREFLKYLPTGKKVYLEISQYETEGLRELVSDLNGYSCEFKKDLSGNYRFMILRPEV
ncbi:peptide chain release factor N(5)-glutamine methyltransferase [Mesotoga prima]|uniref:peptide chain release factor N(5)-glutamine methyltransferase n=1 Tax=Mesotoga prima TaxID=1184387 RepID=UPI002B755C26|nr:peptide chain release factor N(5)-glutamine methyltransferase [Mesotoga prima]MCP5457838.1 peptide chain release factor N(5)-glutamine methyltransferase [Thermotogota bacterium]HNQ70522.1 peptide chain release factor N(5)-glutamine methyltransferase [Mesotoga prima]HQC13977.1 peptide chain release factor N(5)-glutamine methyltransferase [Mesotoga prima]